MLTRRKTHSSSRSALECRANTRDCRLDVALDQRGIQPQHAVAGASEHRIGETSYGNDDTGICPP